MKKRWLMLMMFVFVAAAAQAQPAEQNQGRQTEWSMAVARLEQNSRKIAADIRRDTYVVSQLVAMVGELHDFQKNVAIQKALDRVQATQHKLMEDKTGTQYIFDTLNAINELLIHAREQGSMADLEAVQKEILERTHPIQQSLFRELAQARRDRQSIMDLQTRLFDIGGQLDSALTEALGATFDYMRAGGK